MTVNERARQAAGKGAFVVALCVEYYVFDTNRAGVYEAVSKAINEAVSPFGEVTALKVTSVESLKNRVFNQKM